jgi:Family of unknown function (DUF6516)
MSAELIRHNKIIDEMGNIIEIKLWQLSNPPPDKPHGFKYSLVYIAGNKRIIGYDNSEGKGDHRHVKDLVEPYRFTSVEKLSEDFKQDIERYKRGVL